jgi:hypothetical protein
MNRYLLYGVVSAGLYEKLNGELRPKETTPFKRHPKWGRAIWGESKWGEENKNGVIEHQLNQIGYATSGVSTSPHIERAIFYATYGGKNGYIYVIDRNLLKDFGIEEYVVNEILKAPSVPEDDEVILVAKNMRELPYQIITEIRAVFPQNVSPPCTAS